MVYKMNLNDYVKVIDNSLSLDVCKKLIDLYHNPISEDKKIHFQRNQSPNYTLLNFTENIKMDTSLHRECELAALDAIKKYKAEVRDASWWPSVYGFEQFRIKYYRNNDDDMFKTHVDSATFSSSKRFLLFFWYLNDVDEGGETTIDNLGIKIKPKTGRLVMFPPYWMYPHTGLKPVSGPKYLLSTYLHFIKEDGSVNS